MNTIAWSLAASPNAARAAAISGLPFTAATNDRTTNAVKKLSTCPQYSVM
ncbi:MAG: hypothetical protein IPF66_09350 [Holophagales bacterium]|nr:hypothetical protein [Holophagales bacterium]